MSEWFEEIWEEVLDFFDDFWEHTTKKKETPSKTTRTAVVNGVLVTVRPAYAFAERIENILKLIFGASILVSAATATFLGFPQLSDLLQTLIDTFLGRVIMGTIGISYLVTAFWRLLHLVKTGTSQKP